MSIFVLIFFLQYFLLRLRIMLCRTSKAPGFGFFCFDSFGLCFRSTFSPIHDLAFSPCR